MSLDNRTNLQECGHPIECRVGSSHTEWCAWCLQNAELRLDIDYSHRKIIELERHLRTIVTVTADGLASWDVYTAIVAARKYVDRDRSKETKC